MVVQFVAFVGGFRSPGSLDPWLAATPDALITTWVTFVPGFLFVLLGAPSVEVGHGKRTIVSEDLELVSIEATRSQPTLPEARIPESRPWSEY